MARRDGGWIEYGEALAEVAETGGVPHGGSWAYLQMHDPDTARTVLERVVAAAGTPFPATTEELAKLFDWNTDEDQTGFVAENPDIAPLLGVTTAEVVGDTRARIFHQGRLRHIGSIAVAQT